MYAVIMFVEEIYKIFLSHKMLCRYTRYFGGDNNWCTQPVQDVPER